MCISERFRYPDTLVVYSRVCALWSRSHPRRSLCSFRYRMMAQRFYGEKVPQYCKAVKQGRPGGLLEVFAFAAWSRRVRSLVLRSCHSRQRGTVAAALHCLLSDFDFACRFFLVLASVFPGHRKLCPFRTLQILLCTFEGPTVKRVWSHGTCTGA